MMLMFLRWTTGAVAVRVGVWQPAQTLAMQYECHAKTKQAMQKWNGIVTHSGDKRAHERAYLFMHAPNSTYKIFMTMPMSDTIIIVSASMLKSWYSIRFSAM